MRLKLTILIFIMLFVLSSQAIYGLELLEPITEDLTYIDTVDLGFVSAGESFLISFLIDDINYTEIGVIDAQRKDIIIEKTHKTEESIFTTIKLSKELSGPYTLSLVLKGNIDKIINLDMLVTNKVIYTLLEPITTKVKYNDIANIKLKIINKSNSTKQVLITSNLPKYWFDNKIKQDMTHMLQPNSVSDITYNYIPKEIGDKEFNLQIKTLVGEEDTLFTEEEVFIEYDIKIKVIKNLKGIYGSRDHSFPLFNSNLIPIYFFNKIIKLI